MPITKGGFDQAKWWMANQHYRVKRISIKLTDEEYAKVYKIYQARKAKEGQPQLCR